MNDDVKSSFFKRGDFEFWFLSASKNPQFLPNPYETSEKYLPLEVIIFPKFHKNWAKIVDFLLGHSDFRITFLLKLRLYNVIKHTFDGLI